MSEKTIQRGFILAGLANILGVLTFSKFFTNDAISLADSNVMSNFGMIMILVWGLAYISVSKSYRNVKWLVAVFALEKLVYIAAWIMWHMNNNVANLWESDAFAGAFLSIYGINDILFFFFFAWVFFKVK